MALVSRTLASSLPYSSSGLTLLPREAEQASGGYRGCGRLQPAGRRRRPLLPQPPPGCGGGSGHPENAAALSAVGGSPPDPSAGGFSSFQPLDAVGRGWHCGREAPPHSAPPLCPSQSPLSARGFLDPLPRALLRHAPSWVGFRLDCLPAPFWIVDLGEPRRAPPPALNLPLIHLPAVAGGTQSPCPLQRAPSPSWCPLAGGPLGLSSGQAVVFEVMSLPLEATARTCRSLNPSPGSPGQTVGSAGTLGPGSAFPP